MKRIVVVGAGGFAREVKWLIEEINAVRPRFEFLGYVVSDLSKLGEHDSRDEVLGDFAWLRSNAARVDALALGIGTPVARARVADELLPHFGPERWPALVHPSVRMDTRSVEVGAGAVVCAGVIATVNVRLRPFCVVNLACTIGHEAVIGRAAVLNPTVNVSGGVEIGERVLVGTGSQVLQYLRVGEGATVGAGAVVTRDVPNDETVVGTPAKPLKRAVAA